MRGRAKYDENRGNMIAPIGAWEEKNAQRLASVAFARGVKTFGNSEPRKELKARRGGGDMLKVVVWSRSCFRLMLAYYAPN